MSFYHDESSATISIVGGTARMYINSSKPSVSAKCHTKTTPAGRRVKCQPYTKQTMRTIRKRVRLLDTDSTPGVTYHLIVKVIGEVTPQVFHAAVKKLTDWFTRYGIQWVYAMEWHEYELAPHVHIVANADMDDFPKKAIKRWLAALPFKTDLHKKQCCQFVKAGESRDVLRYVGKEQTKADEFNWAVEDSGEDWSSVIPHGCSRGWQMLPEKKVTVSVPSGHEFRRGCKRFQIAKVVDDPKRKKKIACSLRGRGSADIYKQTVSAVTPFEVERITQESAERLLHHSVRIANGKENDKEREVLKIKYCVNRSPAAVSKRRATKFMKMLRRQRAEMDRRKRNDAYDHYC